MPFVGHILTGKRDLSGAWVGLIVEKFLGWAVCLTVAVQQNAINAAECYGTGVSDPYHDKVASRVMYGDSAPNLQDQKVRLLDRLPPCV